MSSIERKLAGGEFPLRYGEASTDMAPTMSSDAAADQSDPQPRSLGLYGEARIVRTREATPDGIGVDTGPLALSGAIAALRILYPSPKDRISEQAKSHITLLEARLIEEGVSIPPAGLSNSLHKPNYPR